METIHDGVIPVLWLLWAVYWFVAARNVKATSREESVASRIAHLGPLCLAAALLWARHWPWSFLYLRWIPDDWLAGWLGAAMVAAGLAFAIWARAILGRNWSGTVTLKHDHELIRQGPYRFVRHPIYSGLLLAFAGSALAVGQVRGLLALVIVCVALWRKLRLEERWMEETFGAEYAQYRRQVAALIPFLL